MNTKQVIVIRADLNMRKGKMIAQGAHASMKVLLDRMKILTDIGSGRQCLESQMLSNEMISWIEGIFTKICVKVNSEQELLDLYKIAVDKNIPAALIQDCGKTEFNGVPTYTCIAIGPDDCSKIDEVTGHLTLL